MSKSKEKLQQFSPPQTTTTPSSSSSITELKNLTTQVENNKKPKGDETSKFKRNNNDDHHHNLDDHNSVVKKEQSGGGNNNNHSKPKTIENNRNRKKLKDVNDVITCFLCDGYYIEATTINECLHSFCRSCIVQYLQKSKYCPKCKTFNKSISIANLRPDTALRSLVYKLVPGLCQSEIQRLVRFNSNNSASSPTSPTIGGNDLTNDLWDFYSPDEMISLSLEYHIYSVIGEQDHTSSISQIRYLKCPAAVTVHHLQRFISSKFNLKPASKFSIEIIYEDEILPEDFSLMDVAYCYKWERLSPMQFFYRIFVKPEKTVPKPVAKCKKVQSISDQSSPGDDTESHHRVTTPTTIVSTKNNNNNNNNNLNNKDTTNTNNSNKNISNNDKNNVNNGDTNNNNNNNNNDNKSHVKVESNKAKCKEIKKEMLEEVAVKNEKNNDCSNSNSNKIPNINKPHVSVSPPQPPGDFKILRSNDIRYAITPSTVERPVDISPKKSNGEKRSKLSIKIERTQSYDDYNNNNSSRKHNEDVVGSSPIKRRASASNSITLKRKYNKSDDEDESGAKKSRSHHHHHYHHHQKYEIVQSPKVYDDDPDERELNVPKIKLDLPNLKAKIKVPKLELSSKSGDIKSPTVTSSSSNSSSPRCNSDDVFVENSAKYAKTIEGSSNFLSTEQASSSHHHKHHHGDNSSSHKKRKKSKHSKDSPTEELSSNGNGNNGYSSNGSSKKRKIHAEISPQTEKSQDDLKLKFKINYKPTEKQKPPIIPTMVIDDDSSDKIVKTPTSPRIVMTLPVPLTTSLKSPVPTSNPAPPLIATTTSTSASLILPKPSITSSMPTLISTNKTIPTPTISNSISQDVEEVIKRNKIKKSNIEIPHRMSPNTEEILNEMRAIHSATQAIQKPMVNIPHLSQVHLQSNDPIYGSKSPDVKNTNAMLVSIRNTNPMSMTLPSAMRHQHSSSSRPQTNISVMPGRSQKHGNIKPTPFNLNAATFANNTYTHPRTPFPLPKSINLQRKSCYDIDPIDKKSPQKSGAATSIFDFPSEPSSDIFTKKEKNQKRLVPPTLFDEPFSSIINSMAKTSKAIELRAKNLFPVTTATTTTTSADQSPIKSEPPFISSIGNSFISENQNSRTPIQPIQLPPASVSVTNVTNKAASNQIQNQQHLKHSSADHKPVVEILRIQSTTPAVDQQVQPQKAKPNRPPPPLIKRPQTMSVSNTGHQSRRTSSSSGGSDVKKVENISGGTSSKSPKPERKSSSETKEPPVCDNIGALDLSGKSSRSPSLEKSPISKSSSRSNSIEDDSCFNITPSTASATTSSLPKISLSKQKKITDMFPSSSWSVKVENNGSMNISSAERSAAGKSEITITSTTPAPISTVNIGSTSKPPPPKLTEISKLRTYTNSTKSIPTTTATTITSVRQQNLSIRNVPNPSALAFRNQMSPIPISSNNSNSSSNNSNTVYNVSNANSNKTKVNEGKEIEKVIAHLKANAAADSSSKTVAN